MDIKNTANTHSFVEALGNRTGMSHSDGVSPKGPLGALFERYRHGERSNAVVAEIMERMRVKETVALLQNDYSSTRYMGKIHPTDFLGVRDEVLFKFLNELKPGLSDEDIISGFKLAMRRKIIDLWRMQIIRSANGDGLNMSYNDKTASQVLPHSEFENGYERRKSILAALKDMTDPLKFEPLAMHYFGGLSYSDIAARLEIPLGTVKSRIGAAKIDIRNAMATHPHTAQAVRDLLARESDKKDGFCLSF